MMAPSEAQKRATAKWQKEKVEEIKFRVPKGDRGRIQEHAQAQGESTNAFIFRAVHETMERDLGKLEKEPEAGIENLRYRKTGSCSE